MSTGVRQAIPSQYLTGPTAYLIKPAKLSLEVMVPSKSKSANATRWPPCPWGIASYSPMIGRERQERSSLGQGKFEYSFVILRYFSDNGG
jgi:hypothetical protein